MSRSHSVGFGPTGGFHLFEEVPRCMGGLFATRTAGLAGLPPVAAERERRRQLMCDRRAARVLSRDQGTDRGRNSGPSSPNIMVKTPSQSLEYA